jgi:hypothetical protein
VTLRTVKTSSHGVLLPSDVSKSDLGVGGACAGADHALELCGKFCVSRTVTRNLRGRAGPAEPRQMSEASSAERH